MWFCFAVAMAMPSNVDALSAGELRALVADLLERASALTRIVAEQRDEIARLKGMKGRPDIEPNAASSGMGKASRPATGAKPERRCGGPKTSRRAVHETG